MRSPACLLLAAALGAALCAALPTSLAQTAGQTMPPPPPGSSAAVPAPEIEPTLAHLAAEPATHMSMTFDRSALALADQMIQQAGPEARDAVAGLDSITVDTWRYRDDAHYDPDLLAQIDDVYHAAGWKHLVDAHPGPPRPGDAMRTNTDMWLRFSGPNIEGVSILIRSARTMNLIHVNGILKPLDLVHLSGHFGIPRVDPGAVMVPAPNGR
jgi:hypothetical protein